MHRRKFLLTVPFVITGGCTKSPQDRPTNTKTTTQTKKTSETTENQTETTTLTKTTSKTTERHTPSMRLEIRFKVNMKTTLILKRLSDDIVIYENTKEYKSSDAVDLSEEFEADTDYRFTILNANDKQIFDRVIYNYEGYVLSVVSENEVEIVAQEEV